MIRVLAFGAMVACLLVADATARQDEPGRWIQRPDWVRWPSGTDAHNYYPDRASRKKVSGWAVLSCRLDAKGRLKRCKVAAEAPQGWEFGVATLAVAHKFMVGADKSGQSLEGARVLAPLRWTVDGGTAPALGYEPGEPSSLITVADEKAGPDVGFNCPSSSKPDRRCVAHSVAWETWPELIQIADLVRRAKTPMSMMECSVTTSGTLESCRADDSSGLTPADFERLAATFKAPPLTGDKVATSGQRVIITFDWKVLAQVLSAIEAT